MKILATLAAALLVVGAAQAEPVCRDSTKALDAMNWAELRLPTRSLQAKIADSGWKRQEGMQWLCPDRIAASPMLFLLPGTYLPRFHMSNVFAPLDIAFLDAEGRVLEIHLMRPNERLTGEQEASAALEAAAGSFRDWGLKVGDRIEWPPELRALP